MSAPTTDRRQGPPVFSRGLRIVAVPLMLLAGGLVAVQSQVNGQLAAGIGTGPRAGLTAALVSFSSGLLLVAVVVASSPRNRAGVGRLVAAVRHRELRWYELSGGVFGAYLVATQGLTVATIGVALFTVAVTAGQSSSALLVDHLGLGPSGRLPLSVPRAVAAAFAVLAVALAAGERVVTAVDLSTVVLVVLPLLAGAGAALQQALNGRVSRVAGPWTTTLNNFVVGTTTLLLAVPLSFLRPGSVDGLPDEWWLYLGGAMGVGFIALAAWLVKVHGVLVLSLCMIAGQVVSAELIELASPDPHVGIVGVVAGALTVVGVVVALLVRPRSHP
ncbi:DMT family transporter [Aeromicrobium halocynthiae]|uniref:DMT family transporter n=1 Tax=Aeromicrobium halocynthiae TaxID=560557 RepID=A0ABN2VQU9_9ACTN